jgi:hypothetical protein
MKDITFRDLARRYGYFLDYVQRTECLELSAAAAACVTTDRVNAFVAELQARVRSVTVYGSIYKLRRMAQVLDPTRDFSWLIEIEQDLASAMQPQSKFGRFAYSHVLIKAGTDLMTKAEAALHRSALARARQFRNGLMVAMLGHHPIRPKNFATLELGLTFKPEFGSWWIVLPPSETKEKRADERSVDSSLTPWIDRYLEVHRPVLARRIEATNALWLSSNNGHPMTICGVKMLSAKPPWTPTVLKSVRIYFGLQVYQRLPFTLETIPISAAPCCITGTPGFGKSTTTAPAV